MTISNKNKIFEAKILVPKKEEFDDFFIINNTYKVTTWFDDGTKEESIQPCFDLPISMPIYKIKESQMKTNRRIFYKPTLADRIMNNWHKLFMISTLLLIVGKILAHGFRIAA